MDFKDVKDFLNRDVRDIFGPRRDEAGPLVEARCAEAALEMRTRDDRLDFTCRLDRQLLFSVSGRLAGPLSVVPPRPGERFPSTTVSVHVETGSGPATVTITHREEAADGRPDYETEWTLVEATRQPAGDDGSLRCEFIFERAANRVIYSLTIPPHLSPSDLLEVAPRKARFAPLPSAAQMAAVLRAATADPARMRRLLDEGLDPLFLVERLLQGHGPQRIERIVQVFKARPDPRPDPRPPGGEDFEQLLLATGISHPADLVRALCLHVEIEMERITLEGFQAWLDGGALPPLSPYALEAVSQALDLPLLVLSQTPDEVAFPRVREALARLSPPGLLVGIHGVGGQTHFRYCSSRAAATANPDFTSESCTGDVLCRPAVLDHVSEADLTLFLRTGRPVYACFQSDLDRRRIWKKLSPGRSASHSFNFVDGFRAYHFQSCVLGCVQEATGTSAEPFPVIARDDRGTLHFVDPENGPLALGLEKTSLALHLPHVDGLPPLLREMGEERRRGRVEGIPVGVRKLDLLGHVLPRVVSRRDRHRNIAQQPEELAIMRAMLRSATTTSALGPLVDARTLDELVGLLTQDPPALDLWLYEPVARLLRRSDVAHAATLALVHDMCASEAVRLKAGFKNYDRARFRSALLNDWMQLAESDDPEARRAACLLLETSTDLAARNEALVVIYALNRALEQATADAARDAAFALVRLALVDFLPPPRLWDVRPRASSPKANVRAAASRRDAEAGRVVEELKAWMTRMGTCLLGTPSPPAVPAAPRGLAALVASARAGLEELPGGRESHNRFALTTQKALETLLRRLLEGWREASPVLAAESPQDPLANPSERKGCYAYLLEPDRFTELLDLEGGPLEAGLPWRTWSAGEVLGPPAFWLHRPCDRGGLVPSSFLQALLDRAMEDGPEALRLVCFSTGDDLLAMHVLHTGRARFLPFLEHVQPTAATVLDEAEQAALIELIGRTEVDEAGDDVVLRETDASEGRRALLDALKEGRPEARIREAFQLAEACTRHILMIFEAACVAAEEGRPS